MLFPATERRIKEVVSLSRKKGRDQLNSYMIEGVRALEAAMDAGVELVDLFASKEALSDDRVENLLFRFTGRSHKVSEREMGRISDMITSPGILGVAHIPSESTDCLLCKGKILVLDGVQDPGNVGTLIRTAAWFGVEAVVGGLDTADFYAPKTVRAAMGGIWDVMLERVDFLEGFVGTCKRNGADIRYADMDGPAVRDWQPREHSILIIGSEAHGVSRGVRSMADGAVSIESGGANLAVQSLNAAVAGGILMSHW